MSITDAIPEYEIIAPHEALINWKHNKVTQQIKDILATELAYSGTRIGRGETLGDDVAQATARVVGYVEGLQFAVDLLAMKMVVETREDKNETKQASEGA